MNFRRVWPLALGLLVGGCAKAVIKPPTETWVKLGQLKASNRDWSKVEVCMTDPTAVQADIDSMTALLAEFLTTTGAPPDGMWADEHLAMLEQAQTDLAGPLATQRATLGKLRKVQSECKFKNIAKAQELNGQAQKRLEEAPGVVALVKAYRGVAAWKQALVPAMDAAKASCAMKPKGPAKLEPYYAFDDETGHAEWVFCDGAKVVAAPGAPPQYVPPADPKAKKSKHKPEDYLAAAAKRPAESIDRAPRAPAKQAKKADDGQPEPTDGH